MGRRKEVGAAGLRLLEEKSRRTSGFLLFVPHSFFEPESSKRRPFRKKRSFCPSDSHFTLAAVDPKAAPPRIPVPTCIFPFLLFLSICNFVFLNLSHILHCSVWSFRLSMTDTFAFLVHAASRTMRRLGAIRVLSGRSTRRNSHSSLRNTYSTQSELKRNTIFDLRKKFSAKQPLTLVTSYSASETALIGMRDWICVLSHRLSEMLKV